MINKIKETKLSFCVALRNATQLLELIVKKIKEKKKPIILMLLVPLSESKAIFYNVNKKVSWYLFSDHQRQISVVIEDYCNIIIFGVLFWYLHEAYKDKPIGQISLFLFVLNALDLLHLGFYDMQGFVILKIIVAYVIYSKLCSELKLPYWV